MVEIYPNIALPDFGPSTRWEVWAPYKLREDEVIVSTFAGKGKAYNPLDYPEMVQHLARIELGDTEGVLSFVNTWGLLGQLIQGRPPDQLGGDSLKWFFGHVDMVSHCLDLSLLIDEGDAKALDTYLSSRVFSVSNFLGELVEVLSQAQRRGSLLSDASIDLALLLKELTRLVYPFSQKVGGKVRRVMGFHSLIDVVYQHIFDAITQQRIRRCEAEDCGRVFIQTHKRQVYCAPIPPHKRSLCERRATMRRLRAKAAAV